MNKTKKTVTMSKKDFVKENTVLIAKLKKASKGKPASHPLKREMKSQSKELKKVRGK